MLRMISATFSGFWPSLNASPCRVSHLSFPWISLRRKYVLPVGTLTPFPSSSQCCTQCWWQLLRASNLISQAGLQQTTSQRSPKPAWWNKFAKLLQTRAKLSTRKSTMRQSNAFGAKKSAIGARLVEFCLLCFCCMYCRLVVQEAYPWTTTCCYGWFGDLLLARVHGKWKNTHMVGGNIAQQVFSSISISIYVYIPHIYMNRNMYITSTCGDEAPGDSIGTIMKN